METWKKTDRVTPNSTRRGYSVCPRHFRISCCICGVLPLPVGQCICKRVMRCFSQSTLRNISIRAQSFGAYQLPATRGLLGRSRKPALRSARAPWRPPRCTELVRQISVLARSRCDRAPVRTIASLLGHEGSFGRAERRSGTTPKHPDGVGNSRLTIREPMCVISQAAV
jgi:hypothetical protein